MGVHKKNRRIHYLVHWKRTQESKASWRGDTILWQFKDAAQKYLQAKSARAPTLPNKGCLLAP